MQARLSDATLDRVRSAAVPSYDRSTIQAGIVHLGVGAFHRAHQAVYVDDRLSAGERDWGIVGVSLRSPDTRDALAPQDGLYTVVEKRGEGDRMRVIGSLRSLQVAPEDPGSVLARMADPNVRIVTLTVTEKAYLRGPGGDLDLGHPDLAWDLANPDKPRTAFGYLAGALASRRAAGTKPFTVLCCDNLPQNGATLRRLLLQFGEEKDRDLARFIEGEVKFPSTMVDRIVPSTTDEDRRRVAEALGVEDAWPVMTEPFMQWVVQEDFSAGRPRWEESGVTMVKDVRPYEEMKLRLLNGAHSGIAYLGLLLGHASVSAAFGDPVIRGFIDRLWGEAIQTLPTGAGLDPKTYVAALAERFSNPVLVHRTAQIANDGSQKLPQRIVSPARARIGQGAPISHLALVIAAWSAACRERGRTLPARNFADPLDTRLAEIFAAESDAAKIVGRIFETAGFDGEPTSADILPAAVTRHLRTIMERGAGAAIEAAAQERA